jgi:ataxia telangiectasia mutated family protein
MYNSYAAIGIKDTFDIYLDPFTNRSAYLLNTKQCFQMLLEAENGHSSKLSEICYDIGLFHLMNKFTDKQKDQDKAKQYDCLWRLCQWDTVVETEQELKDENGVVDFNGEFNKYHYLSMQCLKNGDEVGTKGAVERARKIILQQLSQQSLECTNTLYKFLEMSHRLVQIEDFGEVRKIHFKK